MVLNLININQGIEFEIKKGKKGDKKNTKKISDKKEDEKLTSKGTLLKKGRHLCDCEGILHEILVLIINKKDKLFELWKNCL